MRLFSNANYKFIEKRRSAYLFSGTLLVLGLIMAVVWQVARGSWVDYGVDFRGGTVVQVKTTRGTTVADLRQLVPDAEVTRFGDANEFLIRAPEFSAEGEPVSDIIDRQLAQKFGPDGYEVVRTEAVGPKVGEELQQRALIAVLLSFGLTLLYLAFRFEWRFGVAAVIATVHDILITLGFISAFQLEVSVTTVAAILTVVGYSLNDTIIVFDRIREELRKGGRAARISDMGLLNRAINETLPRTILTGGTTLATLIALALLGGPILRDFALVLILGIVFGTYSSIFVASPALLEIEKRWGGHPPTRGGTRPARTERHAGANV